METVQKILHGLGQGIIWSVQAITRVIKWWYGKLTSGKSNAATAAWAVGGLLGVCLFCLAPLAMVTAILGGTPESDTLSSVPETTQEPTRAIPLSATSLATDEEVRSRPVLEILEEATATSRPTEPPTSTYTPLPTTTNTPLPTLTRPPTSTPQPQIEVIASSANVRQGPGANYEVVGVMVAGDTAVILAKTQDGSWYNVQLADGSRVWVASSVVELVNAAQANAIRVAVTIPAPPLAAAPTSPPNPTSPPATSAATMPPAPPTQTLPAPIVACACSGPDLNCKDFPNRASAQACYDHCMATVGYDYHGLDGNDNDGLACESLP